MKKKAVVAVSRSTICRGLQAVRLTKKKSKRACPAAPQERAAFQEKRQILEGETCSVLDEFGINLTMPRMHARARSGACVQVTELFHHGGHLSVISALGVHGVCAPMLIEGAINREIFALYIKQFLVPCLRQSHLHPAPRPPPSFAWPYAHFDPTVPLSDASG